MKNLCKVLLLSAGLIGAVGCSNKQRMREEALIEFHSLIDEEYKKYRELDENIRDFTRDFEKYKERFNQRLSDKEIYNNLRETISLESAELFKKYKTFSHDYESELERETKEEVIRVYMMSMLEGMKIFKEYKNSNLIFGSVIEFSDKMEE